MAAQEFKRSGTFRKFYSIIRGDYRMESHVDQGILMFRIISKLACYEI